MVFVVLYLSHKWIDIIFRYWQIIRVLNIIVFSDWSYLQISSTLVVDSYDTAIVYPRPLMCTCFAVLFQAHTHGHFGAQTIFEVYFLCVNIWHIWQIWHRMQMLTYSHKNSRFDITNCRRNVTWGICITSET